MKKPEYMFMVLHKKDDCLWTHFGDTVQEAKENAKVMDVYDEHLLGIFILHPVHTNKEIESLRKEQENIS